MRKSLLVLSLAASVFAGAKNDYEVSGVVGNVQHLGNEHPLSDALSYGLRGGVRVNRWLLGEIAYDRADVDYTKINGKHTALNRGAVNALFEHPDYTIYVPYLIVGGGYESVQHEDYSEKSGAFANYGAGMRFVLSDDFHIKLEVKHAIKQNGHNSLYSTVNFVIPFGYSESKEVASSVAHERKVALDMPPAVPAAVAKPDMPVIIAKTPPAKNFTYDKEGHAVKYTFNVQFDFDKYNIKKEFSDDVNNFVSFMKSHPKITAEILGYADSIGTLEYNMKLSERRAKAVLNEVVKEGIDTSRLSYKGYGETLPIADNNTSDGRYLNRRVEAKLFNNMEH